MNGRRKARGNWRTSFQGILSEFPESGVALRGFRSREGWTQAQLGKKLGLDQSNISKMERGLRPIGKTVAKRLAKIFKTDYRIFL